MYGEDLDPHVYTLLASGVDHIHWAGGAWQTSRGGQGAHGAAGGGHAHAGCMVYLGESWPRELRDSVFLCNIHGSRVNRDSVAPKGSTVVFRHERDFLQSADPWFRGLVLKQGPDDSAFLADWNDTGECHDYDEARVDTGRIFKISYGSGARPPEDLRTLSELELARLQTSKNEWVVRQARRLLAERAAARGAPDTAARNELLALVRAASEGRASAPSALGPARCRWRAGGAIYRAPGRLRRAH
jgi:hypothetical protein